MNLFHLALSCLLGFSIACTTSQKVNTCAPPSGKYINETVLSKCPGSMPSDVPHFCFEINFRGGDTVDIDNGFEKFRLKWSVTGDECTYTIHGATLFGDMVFTLEGDSALQLMDTAWTKLGTPTAFKKLETSDSGPDGFEFLLNECMLAGEYAIFENGELRPNQVTILPNGQLNGFKPYLGYTLCYAGDCLEETDPPARTIELIDEKGNKESFAFKLIEGKMAIEFYRIGPPIPDMKGGRSIGSMVYELRTE